MKKISKGLLTAAVFLIGVPAAAIYGGGGPLGNGIWYRGTIPTSWYSNSTYGNEPCFPETIATSDFPSQGIFEVRVNPAGVANDGNPNTFLNCGDHANIDVLNCIAGLPDGTVVKCSDAQSPNRGPGPNDRVYIVIDTSVGIPAGPGTQSSGDLACDIVIAKTYGEPNPACRTASGGTIPTGGSGGSTSTGGTGGTLSCDANNSTPVAGTQFTASTNGCYSYLKSNGTLKFGNWSGKTFTATVKDSGGVIQDKAVGNGNWFDVPGVANGTVYFSVKNISSGTTVDMQVGAW